MNALTLKNLNLGDIHGYEKNAKIHSERQMQQIIASINQFGVNNPILIDENNEIIAGHNPSLCLIYFEISTNIFPGKELEMLTDIGILSSVLLNTLIIGSGYAIVAMAFRLMFSVSPFFNMALGASVALGAYLGYALLPFLAWWAYPLILAGVILFTWAQEAFIYRPMRQFGASPMVLLVVSLGVYTIFESVIHLCFGPQYQTLGSVMDLAQINLGGAHLPLVQLIIIILGLVSLIGIYVLLQRTFLGKEIRAIAQCPELAYTTGININRVIIIVSIVVGAILGAYGVCVGYDTGMEPTMGFNILFKGMIAAIIGGPTVLAAYLGAMILALAENIGVWFFASQWRDLIAFVIFILLLWLRPGGIFVRAPKKVSCEIKPNKNQKDEK